VSPNDARAARDKPRAGSGGDSAGRGKRAARRRLAEWVSLAISVALIAGIAAYLVTQGVRQQSPLLPFDVRIETERAVRRGERFVLPVMIKNLGDHTARDVRIVVEHQPRGGGGGEKQEQDFDVDYLGEHAEQQIFVYLDEDPKTMTVSAKVVQYRLD
jgi:uncharacterized protein (TIGR02588 family)